MDYLAIDLGARQCPWSERKAQPISFQIQSYPLERQNWRRKCWICSVRRVARMRCFPWGSFLWDWGWIDGHWVESNQGIWLGKRENEPSSLLFDPLMACQRIKVSRMRQSRPFRRFFSPPFRCKSSTWNQFESRPQDIWPSHSIQRVRFALKWSFLMQ